MMGMAGNKGPMRSAGFASPEVALREPIEQDFSLNRRLAHQIYARDKMEGARERREATDAVKQENAKKLQKKRDEEQKKLEKEFKDARARQAEELVKVYEKRTMAKDKVKAAEQKFRKDNLARDVQIQAQIKVETD